MGLFGDIFGYIDTGRAAKSISDSNIAAEHGVLGATANGQASINNQLAGNAAAIGAAGENVNNATGDANAGISAATHNANSTLQGLLDTNQSNLAPAIQSGQQGNAQLQAYAASNPQFHAPTAEEVQNTPGYKFQLQAGSDALTNQASATGLNQSGSTLAALTQYGQGLAGTYYQNAFSNAQNQFQTNQNTTLSNLQALIGSGQAANTQSIAAGSAFGAPQAQNTVNAGNTISSNTIGAANTNASLQSLLAGVNTQGTEYGAGLGVQGAKTAGDFAVGAGTAHAAGIMGQGAALGQGVSDLGSLLTGFGGGG